VIRWVDLIVKLLGGLLIVGFVAFLLYSQITAKRKK
jgi:hypothetical protein